MFLAFRSNLQPVLSERLASGFIPAGGLVIDAEGERYRIETGDVKSLIFSGRPAVVWRERRDGATRLTIEGYAAVNPSGRAVVIRTRVGAWIVPRVSFRRVACGEEGREAVFGLWGRWGLNR